MTYDEIINQVVESIREHPFPVYIRRVLADIVVSSTLDSKLREECRKTIREPFPWVLLKNEHKLP